MWIVSEDYSYSEPTGTKAAVSIISYEGALDARATRAFPNSSVSLEDDLLVKYGINDPEFHHTPESIQRLIEGQHLETRKFLAKYEHVIEGQRQTIQQRRQLDPQRGKTLFIRTGRD